MSGKKTLSVLEETPVKNWLKTIGLLLLAMAIAWCIWYLCMKQLGFWLIEIEALDKKEYKVPRLWFTIIIYSIAVIIFNGQFKKAAGKIVVAENKKYKQEHEESLIQKSYTLGFFNSYLGMAWASFVDQLFANVCGLLLSVLMLKQLILNLIDMCKPKCKEPKRYKAHKLQMLDHFVKYSQDYESADAIEDKEEHYNAEQ